MHLSKHLETLISLKMKKRKKEKEKTSFQIPCKIVTKKIKVMEMTIHNSIITQEKENLQQNFKKQEKG